VPVTQEMTVDEAISSALQNNPELAALRQQYGIAAAEVVIARTYPHNPIFDVQVQSANGPANAGVTNHVVSQYLLLLPLEIRRQGQYRREAANASLSRAEWEIVHHEIALAIRVAKAFQSVIYNEQKLALIDETTRLNQQVAEQVKKLVEAGKLRSADLILARTEIDDLRAQLAPGRSALAASRADLSRGLGIVMLERKLQGGLGLPSAPADRAALTDTALERRPDLRAHQAMVAEAEAKLRLTQSDRFSNPSIGPAYQFNESRVHFIGGQLSVPIPLFNTRRGDIQQKEAERTRTLLELHDTEVRVRQDVAAALARLDNARLGVGLYEQEILPNLRSGLPAWKSCSSRMIRAWMCCASSTCAASCCGRGPVISMCCGKPTRPKPTWQSPSRTPTWSRRRGPSCRLRSNDLLEGRFMTLHQVVPLESRIPASLFPACNQLIRFAIFSLFSCFFRLR